MSTNKSFNWVLIASLAIALGSATPALASPGKSKGKTALAPTAIAPKAKGKAGIDVSKWSRGKFKISVQHLSKRSSYELLVGGIKVSEIHTSGGGSGRARFANPKWKNDDLLGFDPRGESIEVRDPSGDDVLTGVVSTDEDATKITCCIPHDSGAECEDRTEAECTAALGTVVAAGSCLPDPCGATPPPGVTSVCCVPDDSGPECDDLSQSACAMRGGVLVEATSCTPNPCAGTPPPTPEDDDVQCCIQGLSELECEDRTVAACAAAGGINKGPGTCTPNPCSDLPAPADNLCCIANAAGDEVECEDIDPVSCTTAGGVSKGAGVCAIDTCNDVPPPTPDVMCCLPNLAGTEIECQDRTADVCLTQGGVNKGAGVCAIDTCADVPPPPGGQSVQCCERHNGGFECRDRSADRCTTEGGHNQGVGACTLTSCDGL